MTKPKTLITVNGETHTFYGWSKITGINATVLRNRYEKRQNPEDMLLPVKTKKMQHREQRPITYAERDAGYCAVLEDAVRDKFKAGKTYIFRETGEANYELGIVCEKHLRKKLIAKYDHFALFEDERGFRECYTYQQLQDVLNDDSGLIKARP